MQLHVLGSGTGIATHDRFPSAYLVEHEHTKILFDCGPLALSRCAMYSIDPRSIDAVCITHFHHDHFGGLMNLDVTRFLTQRNNRLIPKALSVFGPPSLKKRWKSWRQACWNNFSEQESVILNEELPTEFSVQDIRITPFKVNHDHKLDCFGYRIQVDDTVLVYTGDLGPVQSEETTRHFCDANTLLIEAASLEPCDSHLTAHQAIRFGVAAHANQILLTHLTDDAAQEAHRVVRQIQSSNTPIKIIKDGDIYDI